jgi:hypothetical protein
MDNEMLTNKKLDQIFFPNEEGELPYRGTGQALFEQVKVGRVYKIL